MPRTARLRIATDTGLFTPHQIQPRAMLTLGFNGMSQWVTENLVSHRELVTKYNTGFVMWGLHLEYQEPLSYFETDYLDLSATGMLRSDGAQLEFKISVDGGQRRAAELRFVLAALWIDEVEELSGVAGKVEGDALQLFRPDEMGGDAYEEPITRAVLDLEDRSAPVVTHEHDFTIFRHHCEVADQWYFAEVPRFIAASREGLAKRRGDEAPILRRGLSLPLKRLDILFAKPFYFLDDVVIRTRVFLVDDKPRYVHELAKKETPNVAHAIAIETF